MHAQVAFRNDSGAEDTRTVIVAVATAARKSGAECTNVNQKRK